MFGRTIKLSIAKDNGRTDEFNTRRVYTDKQRCYECGEEGHLSYKCPINVLGNRDIPPKKNNKKKTQSCAVNENQAMPPELEEHRCEENVSDSLYS